MFISAKIGCGWVLGHYSKEKSSLLAQMASHVAPQEKRDTKFNVWKIHLESRFYHILPLWSLPGCQNIQIPIFSLCKTEMFLKLTEIIVFSLYQTFTTCSPFKNITCVTTFLVCETSELLSTEVSKNAFLFYGDWIFKTPPISFLYILYYLIYFL